MVLKNLGNYYFLVFQISTPHRQFSWTVPIAAMLCSVVFDSATPWGVCSPPGSSGHGILQARVLEWVAFSRGSSWPRDWTHISGITGRFFCPEPSWKPQELILISCNLQQWLKQEISFLRQRLSEAGWSSIRVFSNESTHLMRWPKYRSFSFSIQSFQWTPRTDLL